MDILTRKSKSGSKTLPETQSRGSGLIRFIRKQPNAVMSDPLRVLREFKDRQEDLAAAHSFFSQNRCDRYVYSVCTQYLLRIAPELIKKLRSHGMCGEGAPRFWPFFTIFRSEKGSHSLSIEQARCRLVRDWETPGTPAYMSYHLGSLKILKSIAVGHIYCYQCTTQHKPHITRLRFSDKRRYRGSFIIVFDPVTGTYYSMNSRINSTPLKVTERYMEIIDSDIAPPDMQRFASAPKKGMWEVALVLEAHIGDGLSLLSTYAKAFSELKHVHLTVFTSRCELLSTLTKRMLSRAFPTRNITLAGSAFAAHEANAFDLVIDPYDKVQGIFHLKPQNDTGQVSIVSALELAQHAFANKRRDIIDMHMSSVKRFGFASADAKNPEFLRFCYAEREEKDIVTRVRKAFAKVCFEKPFAKQMKIILFCPIGLTDDEERHYPHRQLGSIIATLLRDRETVVGLASGGRTADKEEMELALDASGLMSAPDDVSRRVVVFFNENLQAILNVMLACDAIVAMDSGPLHLARCLRRQPLALYTDKVNRKNKFEIFPWFVDDGTVEILKPKIGERHVDPNDIIARLRRRLS